MDEFETLATVVATRGNDDIWLSEDPRLMESHVLVIEGLRPLGTVGILEINHGKAEAHLNQLH